MKLIALLILFALVGCSTDIDFHMPSNRFDTPEVSGKLFKGAGEVGYVDSHKVKLSEASDDFVFSSSSVSADQTIHKSWNLNLAAELGLWKRLDLVYKTYSDTPSVFGLKFQPFGTTYMDREEGGKHKFSVFVGWGRQHKSDGSMNVADDSGTSRKYDTDLTIQKYDSSLTYGYRHDIDSLFYLTGFYTYYDVESTLSSSEFSPVQVEGIARSYGALFGIQHKQLLLEYGIDFGFWEKNKRIIYPFGVAYKHHW